MSKATPSFPSPAEKRVTRILGIDPGSRRTGVGIIDVQIGGGFKHIHHEVVTTFDEDFPTRLKDIFDGVSAVIQRFSPEECGIESVFLSKNPSSALKLGQARGAAICAAVNANLPVSQYAPREIKKAVVGGGGADKTQVQYMIGVLLNVSHSLAPDAADALAVAITHGQVRETAGRLGLPTRLFR
jgi:crossover junction endodeoxyribonuclease RuvC